MYSSGDQIEGVFVDLCNRVQGFLLIAITLFLFVKTVLFLGTKPEAAKGVGEFFKILALIPIGIATGVFYLLKFFFSFFVQLFKKKKRKEKGERERFDEALFHILQAPTIQEHTFRYFNDEKEMTIKEAFRLEELEFIKNDDYNLDKSPIKKHRKLGDRLIWSKYSFDEIARIRERAKKEYIFYKFRQQNNALLEALHLSILIYFTDSWVWVTNDVDYYIETECSGTVLNLDQEKVFLEIMDEILKDYFTLREEKLIERREIQEEFERRMELQRNETLEQNKKIWRNRMFQNDFPKDRGKQ